MKKLVCLILALVMVLGLATTAFAGEGGFSCPVPDCTGTLEYKDVVPATCTADGTNAHWECNVCLSCYAGKAGQPTQEPDTDAGLDELALKIEKTAHNYTEPVWTWEESVTDADDVPAVTLVLKCKDCEDTLPKTNPYVEPIAASEATCGAKASVTYKASLKAGDDNYEGTKRYEYGDLSGSHSLKKIAQVDPTTTKTGTKEHWKCEVCGKLFWNAKGTDPVNDEKDLTIEKKTSTPTYKTYTVKFDTNGGYMYYDSVCEYVGYTIDLDDYVPTKYGYTFCGWYNYSLTTRYRVVSSVTAPSTVYAKWVKNGDWYCPYHAYGKCPTTCAYYEYNCSGTTCYWTLRDISTSDWYYNHVCYVVDKGILKPAGVWFEPDVKLTRAELASAIYAIAGEPAVTPTGKFRDVSKYDSYACAVEWGETYGILQGIGNKTFAPKDNVTREQMAAIFYRFANYLEKYGTKGTLRTSGFYWGAFKELTFKDAKSVSTWAKDAVRWSVDNCLFTGDNWNRFNPKGNITRAEAAAVLSRFCK